MNVYPEDQNKELDTPNCAAVRGIVCVVASVRFRDCPQWMRDAIGDEEYGWKAAAMEAEFKQRNDPRAFQWEYEQKLLELQSKYKL